jgi:hypothetical protein
MQIPILLSILCATSNLALPAQEEAYREIHSLGTVRNMAAAEISQPLITRDHAYNVLWSGLASRYPFFLFHFPYLPRWFSSLCVIYLGSY